jgi:hypothetical protein
MVWGILQRIQSQMAHKIHSGIGTCLLEWLELIVMGGSKAPSEDCEEPERRR